MTELSVGVVKWNLYDGLSQAIFETIADLGHRPSHFLFNDPVPSRLDVVFSFAPYNKFLVLANRVRSLPGKRPIFIHWDTEMQVNPAVPGPLMLQLANIRSWYGRRFIAGGNVNKSGLQKLDQKLYRLQCLGDYRYALINGWLDILFEFSNYFTDYLNNLQIPAIYVPWGTHHGWYADLGIERDIDVLWMGALRTRRRREIFYRLKSQLEPQGVRFFVADNENHPFIYGDERIKYLNRSKITINILPSWYISNLSHRFAMAAGNRSLVISEFLLPHNPTIVAGTHYVSCPVDQLAETVLYYLEHSQEREAIAENAYALATKEMTLRNSVNQIMEHVESFRIRR